ncbi:terpenoid cyclases/protein prenyltransferase alpha-alpha toroid [Tricharina praecox]|uniref:terpenoid cyclases/protein prenyltransferase alpha-alpha toroid n=1 Tax=Tricharina praecox TaxID=43433 RepID=UPI00221F696C|nr:terpenoid cyclases/protein prenyltransferase alpha-alpha toroid [Tricharina praecox]KAI5859199.1 terpenoid cyclases/protein prenyltransferase alpha-alpha toroid [Tricharina praecox]
MQIRNPKRTRTRFRHQQRTTMSSSSSPPRIEELSISSPTPPDLSDVYPFNPSNRYIPPPMAPRTPSLFSSLPVLRDLYSTPTQIEQDSVVSRILPLLSSPLPRLKRQEHIEFLEGAFEEKLPDYMTVLDASRPWIVYWCITGLSLLGVDVSVYRERVISTFTPLQHPRGGFGGGHGQLAHLAPTYAAVLSLASVGASTLDMINRRTLLSWLHTLKSPNGSFSVCAGGETDVRGVYCALTIISLLRLPTDAGLLTNTSTYLSACQTYEGGFAATPNGNEAHGGYTFCALAALLILHPPDQLAATISLANLTRWLSARQYAPEGGLSGRTNKLVDGCYSTWIGACWPLVEACVASSGGGGDGGDGAADLCLWSREGLVRYVLAATQAPHGGLRDKPGKGPDFYHTAYILLGYSAAIHMHSYQDDGNGNGPKAAEADVDTLAERFGGTLKISTSPASTTTEEQEQKWKQDEQQEGEQQQEQEQTQEQQQKQQKQEQQDGQQQEQEPAQEQDVQQEQDGLPLLSAFNWKVGEVIDGLVADHKGWPDVRWDEDAPTWDLGLPGDRVRPCHLVFNIRTDFVDDVVRWGEKLVQGEGGGI